MPHLAVLTVMNDRLYRRDAELLDTLIAHFPPSSSGEAPRILVYHEDTWERCCGAGLGISFSEAHASSGRLELRDLSEAFPEYLEKHLSRIFPRDEEVLRRWRLLSRNRCLPEWANWYWQALPRFGRFTHRLILANIHALAFPPARFVLSVHSDSRALRPLDAGFWSYVARFDVAVMDREWLPGWPSCIETGVMMWRTGPRTRWFALERMLAFYVGDLRVRKLFPGEWQRQHAGLFGAGRMGPELLFEYGPDRLRFSSLDAPPLHARLPFTLWHTMIDHCNLDTLLYAEVTRTAVDVSEEGSAVDSALNEGPLEIGAFAVAEAHGEQFLSCASWDRGGFRFFCPGEAPHVSPFDVMHYVEHHKTLGMETRDRFLGKWRSSEDFAPRRSCAMQGARVDRGTLIRSFEMLGPAPGDDDPGLGAQGIGVPVWGCIDECRNTIGCEVWSVVPRGSDSAALLFGAEGTRNAEDLCLLFTSGVDIRVTQGTSDHDGRHRGEILEDMRSMDCAGFLEPCETWRTMETVLRAAPVRPSELSFWRTVAASEMPQDKLCPISPEVCGALRAAASLGSALVLGLEVACATACYGSGMRWDTHANDNVLASWCLLESTLVMYGAPAANGSHVKGLMDGVAHLRTPRSKRIVELGLQKTVLPAEATLEALNDRLTFASVLVFSQGVMLAEMLGYLYHRVRMLRPGTLLFSYGGGCDMHETGTLHYLVLRMYETVFHNLCASVLG